MAKATHNGTCQVCGAVHAVDPNTGQIAKHGYTVDWGMFNGTCQGSDRQALELSAELANQTVGALRKRAKMLRKAASEPITQVLVTRGHGRQRERVMMDEAEFTAKSRYGVTWDSAVGSERDRLTRNAAHCDTAQAELLLRIEARSGMPLYEREVDLPIHREFHKTYSQMEERGKALKAAGVNKVTTRSQRGGLGRPRKFIVTYRAAERLPL